MSISKTLKGGYKCPVRGCPQARNRSFTTIMGVAKHISAQHGEEELQKRLRVKAKEG